MISRGFSLKFARTRSGISAASIFSVPKGIDEDADRLGNTDGVSELHFAAISQTGGDDVFGDIARHVSGRAIDLRRIFAAECAAAVTSHAAVGVDDDLAAGQAGIAHRTANYEAAGGIDVVLRVFIEQVRGNDGLDNVLQNIGAQFVVANGLGMLGRDHDGIDALHFVLGVVFHGDLGFSVGTKVRAGSVLADFRKFWRELVGQ